MKPLTRRTMLGAGGVAAVGPLTALFPGLVFGQAADSLTIAYNVALPSWDPTSGPSSVNPTLQAIWKSVFDQFIDQNNDASFKPGLLTKWGWNAGKTKVEMEVRSGAVWHDGTPVTAQDILWNLNRAADPKTGNPVGAIIWSSLANLKADGNKITGDVKQYVATCSSGWPSSPAT